jgi:nucleoside permease NupC
MNIFNVFVDYALKGFVIAAKVAVICIVAFIAMMGAIIESVRK